MATEKTQDVHLGMIGHAVELRIHEANEDGSLGDFLYRSGGTLEAYTVVDEDAPVDVLGTVALVWVGTPDPAIVPNGKAYEIEWEV